jgi:hypothetical protein
VHQDAGEPVVLASEATASMNPKLPNCCTLRLRRRHVPHLIPMTVTMFPDDPIAAAAITVD